MTRNKKFWLGGLVIVLCAGYLAYTGLAGSATYYYTVNEAVQQQDSLLDKTIRINGQVAANSVQSEGGGLITKFTLLEEGASLPVVYKGVVPDTFQDGSGVVVEGHISNTGIFQADSILTKCPSKYVPQKQ